MPRAIPPRARRTTLVTPGRRVLVLAAVAALAIAACSPDGGGTAAPQADDERNPRFEFHGPDNGALIAAHDLEDLRFAVSATDEEALDDLEVLLDDTPVPDVERRDQQLVYTPGHLEDGDRVVTVRLAPPDEPDTATEDAAEDATEGDVDATEDDEGDGAEVLHEWRVTVDTVPPEVTMSSPDGAVVAGEPATVAGTTEADAAVTVGGVDVEVDADGSFSLDLDDAEPGTVTVVAVDPAGNATEIDLEIVVVPSRATVDRIQAVHVSFYGWAAPSKRDPIIEMIEDGLVNAVQLDLKDESGDIGYASEVPLAQEMGAARGIYDLEAAVAELHAMGVPVIGRIVAFADPVLANWAWENDARDWVVQTPDGEMYTGRYAGFSNLAHEDIHEYNIAVAEEAARLGVDHILWDYIRRPDGSLENMVIPGLTGTPEEAIVEFTRKADERLARYGVEHGASVYGIAATRPHEIGQDIPAMARHLDYVAPMVYPSHWGPGEYDVADPNRQPYDIVNRSLQSFLDAIEGTGARVVPWLEDTRFRAWDRPFQVREQIRGAADRGIDEWMLWDPWVDYTPEALDPIDP